MLLSGKKALVTGGSRGIGKEIVKAFLAEGASVWYVSTKESPHADEFERAAKEHGVSVVWKKGDVGNEAEITKVVEEILTESDGIDVLVNNAGITRDGLVFRMSSKDWDDVLRINLTSAFYVSRAVANRMIKRKSGSIINVSSIVGLIGNFGQTNYAASKAGLVGFSKSLAREVASRGVRVNVIAPGYIRTDMTDGLKEEHQEKLKEKIPLQRIGEAEEIAKAALFLASDLSSYVTGQVLGVDGGMGM